MNKNIEIQKLKTFEVYHLESNDGFNDRYFNRSIEAENLDKAIETIKKILDENDYKGDFVEVDTDRDMFDHEVGLIQLDTDFSDENGNDLTMDEVNKLCSEKDMDIADLIENGIIGYLDHHYEIIET